MTASKALEYRITQQLLQRHSTPAEEVDYTVWADRIIAVLAATAGLFLAGSYLGELLWAMLGAGTLLTLAVR